MVVYVYDREGGYKLDVIKDVVQVTERILYKGVYEYVIITDSNELKVFKKDDVKIRVYGG